MHNGYQQNSDNNNPLSQQKIKQDISQNLSLPFLQSSLTLSHKSSY